MYSTPENQSFTHEPNYGYAQPDACPTYPTWTPTFTPEPKKPILRWMALGGVAMIALAVVLAVVIPGARTAVHAASHPTVVAPATVVVTAPAVVAPVQIGLNDPVLLDRRVLDDFRLVGASDPTRWAGLSIDSVDCTRSYGQVFNCDINATQADGSPSSITSTVTVALDGSGYTLNN